MRRHDQIQVQARRAGHEIDGCSVRSIWHEMRCGFEILSLRSFVRLFTIANGVGDGNVYLGNVMCVTLANLEGSKQKSAFIKKRPLILVACLLGGR